MSELTVHDRLFWGLRLSFAPVWWALTIPNVFLFTSAPMPTGIWAPLLPHTEWPFYSEIYTASALVCLIFYIKKKPSIWSFWALFALSTCAFCMEEANGIHNRNALISWLFLAQGFSAIWPNATPQRALQFSLQVVCGAYFLSALSKLVDAGLQWPIQGYRIGLQIAKSFHQEWADLLNPESLNLGRVNLEVLDHQATIIPWLLGFALLTEFLSPLALLSPKWKWFVAIGLLLMHVGIFVTMNIFITSIGLSMFLVMFNPVGWALTLRTKA